MLVRPTSSVSNRPRGVVLRFLVLSDRNDHTVRRVELFGAGQLGQGAVLGLVQVDEHNTLVGDLNRLFVEDEVDALQLGIAGFILAGGNRL